MRGAYPTTVQGNLWTPPLAEVCLQSSLWGGLWAWDRGAVKCMTLHLWAANLKPFLVMVNGLICQLVNSFISVYATMAWYPAETNMCAFVIQQPEQVHDMANKRVLSVFILNRLQAGHWVRVNYYIVVDWAHVLVIVQCQNDGCSLSSKDGAGNILVKWRQVVSPFWKWRLITTAASNLSFISEPSVKTSSCDPRVSQYSLNLAGASGLEIMHLFIPSMRLCLFGL